MNEQKPEKTNLCTGIRFLPLLLLIIGLVAYINTFNGPFIFDDIISIKENPDIRSLWQLDRVLFSPRPSTVIGRPILSLSLALNYAADGYKVWGYHAVNLAIHLLAGLTLYGIVRRTLLSDRLRARFGEHAEILAWITATIWVIHPIQTESVTYIVQRAESLMGLFYLLTLYAVIRGIKSRRAGMWFAASVLCCALGMATKKVMVTAPIIVLLYDRAFGAGSFASALRRRWGLYAGLTATWSIFIALAWKFPPPASEVGFSVDVSPLDYFMNQCIIIVHYIRLSLWPVGLCIDYGWPVVEDWHRIVPPMLVIIAMLSITTWGLIRNYSWSYLGVWFFGILAPTSSFIPIVDLMFEHRMYLSLAALILLLVITVYLCLQYAAKRLQSVDSFNRWVRNVLVIAVIAALTLATLYRNEYYSSTVLIWKAALDISPNNPRVHIGLGSGLSARGDLDDAISHYQKALQLKPDHAKAHYSLGNVLLQQGRFDEAIKHYKRASQLAPDYAKRYDCYVGNIFLAQGKFDEAIDSYHQALQLNPQYAKLNNNLGSALLAQGKFDEALKYFNEALRLEPDMVPALFGSAWILATHQDPQQRNPVMAVKLAERAIKLTEYHSVMDLDTLAACYAAAGRFNEAQAVAQKALELASESGNEQLTREIRNRLELYKKAEPYQQPRKSQDITHP